MGTVRFCAPCLGVPVLLAGASPAALAAASDYRHIAQDDLTFVSLDMGGHKLADAIDAYAYGNGRLCLDLEQFVQALEFQIRYAPDAQTARGWFLDESRLFLLDLRKHHLNVGGIERQLPADSIMTTDLGLCVATDVLQDWFPVNLTYEPSGALVSLASRESLPVEVRAAREARKRELQNLAEEAAPTPARRARTTDYAWFNIPSFDIFTRFSAGQDEGGASRTIAQYSGIAVGELARMTAETLFQSDASGVPQSLRMRFYRRDPRGGVFGIPALTDITVGDVSGLSTNLLGSNATGRGISVSSYPLNMADEYDRTTLRGDMPIGWEAELYRNDALIAFQNASRDGRYEFPDVPVFFGLNEFRLVFYGPQGQRRTETRTINTGQISAPRGKLMGRMVIQQDGRELINLNRAAPRNQPMTAPWRFQAEARMGVLSNLSLGASLSSFEIDRKRETFGSLSAQTGIGRTSLELEGITGSNGSWAGQVTAQRSFTHVGMQVRHAQFSRMFNSQKVTSGIKSRSDMSLTATVPLSRTMRVPLSLRATLDTQYDGPSSINIAEQSSFSLGQHNFAQSLSAIANLGPGSKPAVIGSFLYSRRFQGSGVRAFLNYEVAPGTAIRSVGLGYDQYAGRNGKKWFWNSNVDWQVQEKVGTLSLGASREFQAFSLNLDSSANTRGAWSLGASLSFSLDRDPLRSRWRMRSEASAQSGRVIARVFEDMDGNGHFNDGDQLLKDASVTAGNRAGSLTGADGRAFLARLPSDTPMLVQAEAPEDYPVDLVPSHLTAPIISRAGTISHVDLPLIVAGSVEGQIDLVGDMARKPLKGIMVKLIGDSQTAIRYTEFDGYYLFQDVPTGLYRIELDEEQLRLLGLAGLSGRDVEVTRQRPYPAGINFRLGLSQPPAVIVAAAEPDRPITASTTPRIISSSLFSDVLAQPMPLRTTPVIIRVARTGTTVPTAVVLRASAPAPGAKRPAAPVSQKLKPKRKATHLLRRKKPAVLHIPRKPRPGKAATSARLVRFVPDLPLTQLFTEDLASVSGMPVALPPVSPEMAPVVLSRKPNPRTQPASLTDIVANRRPRRMAQP